MSGGRENRREARYRIRIPATLVRGPASNRVMSEDVSLRGLFLRTDLPLTLRQLVRIKIMVPPEAQIVETHGMIVHAVAPGNPVGRIPGIGVQFFAMDGPARVRWERFIRYVRETYANAEHEAMELEPAGGARSDPAPLPEPIRREHPRIPARLQVRVRTADDLFQLYTRDVSRGGLFLTTELDLAMGQQLGIDFVHPDTGEAFPLKGVVRHRVRRPGVAGVGVQFLEMDDAIRDRLFDFISSDIEIDEEPSDELVSPDDPRLA